MSSAGGRLVHEVTARGSLMVAILIVPTLLAFAGPASAQVIRPFAPRFNTMDRGDILLAGNTLTTCRSGDAGCAAAQNGQGGSANNNWVMQHVDIDGDPSTFNSSRAALALPAGASVLWAGLYWSGDSQNGTRSMALFATPASGYATVAASQLDVSGGTYQGFTDVTARVQAGGSGTYAVANVQTRPGAKRFAGWTLVVAYASPAEPQRNMVVFDGLVEVLPGASVTIPVIGLQTPPAGIVNTHLGVLAWEGEQWTPGDRFLLDGTPLGNGVNPPDNFFNSSISNLGAHVTAKAPDYVNNFGIDIDRVAAPGVLPNGATSATIVLESTNDHFFPGVVTFATDFALPVLGGGNFTKTVADLNGGSVVPGDLLEYTIAVRNSGSDASQQTVVRDTIPANAVYEPGSMAITAGANAGPKSDAPGDDQAEFAAASNEVVIRVGTGAGSGGGGTLAPGEATTLRFRVRIASPVPAGSIVSNQAHVAFFAPQLGLAMSEASDADTLIAGAQRTDVTVTGISLGGHAYLDANHNLQRDGGEGGTGAALWTKLVPASAPGSALAAAPVDPVSGAYAFGLVANGSYTLILDTNASLADVAPDYPAGHIGTEAAGGVRAGVTIGAVPLSNEDFGLWFGSRAEGRVVRDDGAGGGTANDGRGQGGESGVAGAPLRLAHPACAGGVCDSTITDGGGTFVLWAPGAAGGGAVTLSQTNLAGWLSTGGFAGGSGGAYNRGADAITFTATNGVVQTGLELGDVPANTFVPAGNRSGTPGTFVLHPHTFTAGSAGSVTFAATQTPAPPVPGWTADVWRDLDCDGVLDAGEPPLAGAVPVVVGETLCLLLRHVIPLAAPTGAAETVTLDATMDYTGASPALAATVSLADVTTSGGAGTLEISKAVDLSAALPGDLLTYTITYRNSGLAPLTSIVIQDATPAWTVFESAACGSLGGGLSGCGVSSQPAVGATGQVTWSLAGPLNPGESGTVTFRVRVE